jgi:hypothetical protein
MVREQKGAQDQSEHLMPTFDLRSVDRKMLTPNVRTVVPPWSSNCPAINQYARRRDSRRERRPHDQDRRTQIRLCSVERKEKEEKFRHENYRLFIARAKVALSHERAKPYRDVSLCNERPGQPSRSRFNECYRLTKAHYHLPLGTVRFVLPSIYSAIWRTLFPSSRTTRFAWPWD